jgi:predicted enzyme related to lactoylglutathione lyase
MEAGMAIQLGYYTIGVKDVARGVTFFGALFDWTFESVSEQYAHVSNTAVPCGLHKTEPADLSAFYFRVTDIEISASKVKTLGGKADAITKSPSGLGCRCIDDQGTIFSLWQPAGGF